jgi:hypothetical protein
VQQSARFPLSAHNRAPQPDNRETLRGDS